MPLPASSSDTLSPGHITAHPGALRRVPQVRRPYRIMRIDSGNPGPESATRQAGRKDSPCYSRGRRRLSSAVRTAFASRILQADYGYRHLFSFHTG